MVAISFFKGSSQSRDLPDLGIEHGCPALTGRFFTTEPPGKPTLCVRLIKILYSVNQYVIGLGSEQYMNLREDL